MKNNLENIVRNSASGKFLIRKCAESEAWAWGVTAVGIGLIVLIVLI